MPLDPLLTATLGQLVANGVESLLKHAVDGRNREEAEQISASIAQSLSPTLDRISDMYDDPAGTNVSPRSAADFQAFLRSTDSVQCVEALIGYMVGDGQSGRTSYWFSSTRELLHVWIDEPDDVEPLLSNIHALLLTLLAGPVDKLRNSKLSGSSKRQAQERAELILARLKESTSQVGTYRVHNEYLTAFQKLRRAAFRDLEGVRPASDTASRTYQLDDIYVVPTLTNLEASEGDHEAITLDRALTYGDRFVFVGDPGAGKTTLARHLARELNRELEADHARVGLVLTLRLIDLDQGAGPHLVDALHSEISSLLQEQIDVDFIGWMTRTGRLVLFCDGLDELSHLSSRTRMVTELERFASAHPCVPVISTSRKIGYNFSPLNPEAFCGYAISPFSKDQVREYTVKWFAAQGELSAPERNSSVTSLEEETSHVADLISNPLLLSLICTLYRTSGYIPSNRPEVYRKCADLLFYDWDRSRKIDEAALALPLAVRRRVLEDIAHWYITQPSQVRDGVTAATLESRISTFLIRARGIDPVHAGEQAEAFVRHATGRAWILTDVGTTRHAERYDFTHRTFLEYFAASYMVSTSESAPDLAKMLKDLLNKQVAGSLVPELALQIYDDAKPNGSSNLVLNLLAELSAAESSSSTCQALSFILRSMPYLSLDTQSRDAIAEAVCALLDSSQPAPAEEVSGLFDAVVLAVKSSDEVLPRAQVSQILQHMVGNASPGTRLAIAFSLNQAHVDPQALGIDSTAVALKSGDIGSIPSVRILAFCRTAHHLAAEPLVQLIMPASLSPMPGILLPPLLSRAEPASTLPELLFVDSTIAFAPSNRFPPVYSPIMTLDSWKLAMQLTAEAANHETTHHIAGIPSPPLFKTILHTALRELIQVAADDSQDLPSPQKVSDRERWLLLFTFFELAAATTKDLNSLVPQGANRVDWSDQIGSPDVPQLGSPGQAFATLYWSTVARRVGQHGAFVQTVSEEFSSLPGEIESYIRRESPLFTVSVTTH